MDRLLYTAMSGARQSMDQQAVINNNLANVTTTGFRGQLNAMRAVPVQGEGLPTRASVMASTPGSDFSAGPLNTTGRPMDVAIDGDGWLSVQTPDGEAYTRRGDLQVDANGVVNVQGRPVLGVNGPIVVPLGADVRIGSDGTLSAQVPGTDPVARGPAGQLKLVNPQPGDLVRGDDGLFRPRPDANGQAPAALQADDTVRVVSGALEGSNVSPTEAMVAMIDSARRYDMQMKVISSADENAQRANSLLSVTS
ncbi:flagellar basal-body rod protein FlgF [Modicisalibacter tunisiensis]|uniref:Flagellar basal-body rod protein FlgF n=1 Tax=Modicisalibacter tunisiensis TaxID=390637 RepID=A0ABS7X052_9GAMM|nr:flagellar basal-body rod protein FlgF [Modicisalibacter tunisiensis]KXS39125.1 MAG: flagellar basal-body rod protein FlgF [Halomonadaceae bacterium T82-2]MBZ9568265.1 flagellar basal-body rod protein FlgF [Modicisalibacter tunisiensis]